MNADKKIIFAIVVILAALGIAWYFFRSYELYPSDPNLIETTRDPSLQKIESMSSSDETSEIEADLNATDFSNLDRELGSIEAEFEAQLGQ